MIVITRNGEYVEKDWTQAEFEATSLPIKGWTIYTGEWPIPVPPPVPVIPTSVTMRQARLQLLTLGLYDDFLAALSQMSQAAQIEAEYATSVDRNNPLTLGMVALFGWTDTDTDNYFIAASEL